MSNYLSINYDYTLFYSKNRVALDALVKEKGKWEVNKNNVREFQAAIKKLQKRFQFWHGRTGNAALLLII